MQYGEYRANVHMHLFSTYVSWLQATAV